jgi:hypothetical protein
MVVVVMVVVVVVVAMMMVAGVMWCGVAVERSKMSYP